MAVNGRWQVGFPAVCGLDAVVRVPAETSEILAHPTEGCAGGFQGMAQASNDNLCELSLDLILGLPGETELSSNGVDLRRISRETILS